MIVQIFRETRPTAETNILQDNIDQIDNDNTLRSMFSGDSFPTNPAPVVGQPCYRTDLKKLFIYTTDGWVEIMGKPIYDPRSVSADVFHMDNMTEGANTKIMTAEERIKLNNTIVDPSGYNFLPIGVPIPVWDHFSIDLPPNSGNGAIYIRLTAGQSGPGNYNHGLLRDEMVSGAAPLVTATAVINLPSSPIYNQTVHLINTEEAFIRARTTSGELQNDQIQQLTGQFGRVMKVTCSGVFAAEGGVQVYRDGTLYAAMVSFDSSRVARSGNETRSKNVSATWYLRIR